MTKADGQIGGLFCKTAHCQTLAEHISVLLESRYGYPQVVEYLIVGASSGPYGIHPPLLRFLYWGWRSDYARRLFISPRQAIRPLTETTEPVESRATRLNSFVLPNACGDFRETTAQHLVQTITIFGGVGVLNLRWYYGAIFFVKLELDRICGLFTG